VDSVERLSARQPVLALLMLVFLVGAVGWGVYQHRPPEPLPKNAPPERFSAERAMEHIHAIAQKPHPTGTVENAAVRDYIQQSLVGMGLTPEVQEAFHQWKEGYASTVQNVLARIPGSESSGAIALVGHYDSVAFGPGASDDGAGVAALLETARALKSLPALKNDVFLVFTDGEEGRMLGGSGLAGARAFVRQHPWAKEVAVVINFDCRGNQGVSYLYETSPDNGWLIEQLAKSGAHPIATSLMYDVYRSMPVGSDFTAFKDENIPGYNCAFVDGLRIYHTALDNPQHVSHASVQHHGEYALNLTRQLGNLSLKNTQQPGAVYFNTVGYHLLYYPMAWARPIALGIGTALLAIILFGVLKKRVTFSGMAMGVLAFLAFAVIMTGISALIAVYGYTTRGPYLLFTENKLTLALMALAVCTATSHLAWMARRISLAELAMGALLPWAGLMAGTAWYSPGSSYLFAWPVLFSALGLLVLFLSKTSRRIAVWQAIPLAATALPGIFLVTALMTGFQATLTVLFSPVNVLFGCLLIGLLVPHLYVIAATWSWPLPLLTGAAALLGFWMATAGTGFSAEYPKMDSLAYGLDADRGKAFWMSCDKEPDEWTGSFFPKDTPKQFIREFFPDNPGHYLKAPAAAAMLPPPSVTLLSDDMEKDIRTLHLRVSSPRQAPVLELYAGEEVEVLEAAVDRHPLKPVEGRWFLVFNAFPRTGIELTIKVATHAPFSLKAIDHSYGFPELAGFTINKRPPHIICKPNTVDFNKERLKTDETLVGKTYRF